MTAFIGRSGTDAIFKALHRICIVVQRYGTKAASAIALAQTGGIITSAEALEATTFLSGAAALCDIFKKISENSGF